jgi:hypothetical protein
MRSHACETIRTENVSSLFNTAYKQIAAVAKAMSESVWTGIYLLKPDVFSEEDFISGEVPNTVSVIMFWRNQGRHWPWPW